jgi:imidazolonepropionase-like amidohydrolase
MNAGGWRLALVLVVAGAVSGDPSVGGEEPYSGERGSLRLHYIQKPIGVEQYEIVRRGNALEVSSAFEFTDRGGRVELHATLETAADFTPISFRAKGKSYRFVNVDSEVAVERGSAIVRADGAARGERVALPAAFFTVDGYAPFAAQMLLVRYWLRHGRPALVRTMPGLPPSGVEDVEISARGRETISVNGKAETFDRFSIDGVVWGREALWLDRSGALAAAITRAGGLSFEAVREDLEPALLDFVRSSTRDRIADLESITRRVAPVRTGTFALVGATIVDGTDRPPTPDGVVVVRDGRIADVGPATAVMIPREAIRVDVAGKTIIAGLWDMHTHVTQIEWAPVYLAAGATTVRDMGNEFEFITALHEALGSHRALGPRLLRAGLVDGGGPNAFGVVNATTVEEATAVVEKYHAAGFEQIKIYSLVTRPVVAALCAEAHRRGMTVTGHLPNGMTIEEAVEAGMDGIAHLSVRGEPGSDELNKRVAFLREHGTSIDPTQSWNELLGHAQGAPIEAFQPAIHKIPPPLDRLFSNAGVAGIDTATARARLERGLRVVRALHDGGVPIVAGTDEGIPGHSLHREIELYVEAGLSPLAALQAATIVPARVMKLDAELGTIERGKRADLAVLDANPLDAIRNIRTVRWTIADGKMYESAALWESVRFKP